MYTFYEEPSAHCSGILKKQMHGLKLFTMCFIPYKIEMAKEEEFVYILFQK